MHRLKRFATMGLALVAVAVIVSIITEGRAIAQAVRAALVQNTDEPGRHPYLEYRGDFTITSNVCILHFSPVPAGERLVVTHVNGIIGLAVDQFNGPVTLTNAKATFGQWFPAVFSAVPNTLTSLFNAPTEAYFEAGDTPILYSQVRDSYGTLAATLSGYYIIQP